MQMSVDAIKQKINSMTGTSVLTMTLQLKDETGRLVATLDNESRKFGFYSPRDGFVLLPVIVLSNPSCGQLPSVCVCAWLLQTALHAATVRQLFSSSICVNPCSPVP
eukprot:GHRR01028075.1.p1 GENE.GHRR01028075.1~~GHRR01028075.1.p1  ORF type:complete len:107 (+),score=25.53 GHRR01028075.1:343-663(+)